MKRLFRLTPRSFLVMVPTLVVFASTVALAEPPDEMLHQNHARLKPALALQSAVTPDLMQLPDVLGSAVGLNEGGQPSLVVFVDQNGAAHKKVLQALPAVLGGIPVRPELTDKIRAFAGK